jgi:hypothetical protein
MHALFDGQRLLVLFGLDAANSGSGFRAVADGDGWQVLMHGAPAREMERIDSQQIVQGQRIWTRMHAVPQELAWYPVVRWPYGQAAPAKADAYWAELKRRLGQVERLSAVVRKAKDPRKAQPQIEALTTGMLGLRAWILAQWTESGWVAVGDSATAVEALRKAGAVFARDPRILGLLVAVISAELEAGTAMLSPALAEVQDLYALCLGEPQPFGTQTGFRLRPGTQMLETIIPVIADTERLAHNRLKAGLPPMEVAAAQMSGWVVRIDADGREVKDADSSPQQPERPRQRQPRPASGEGSGTGRGGF